MTKWSLEPQPLADDNRQSLFTLVNRTGGSAYAWRLEADATASREIFHHREAGNWFVTEEREIPDGEDLGVVIDRSAGEYVGGSSR